MSAKTIEFVDPKSVGARRLKLQAPIFDAYATQRAELAIAEMREEISAWLDSQVEALSRARDDLIIARYSNEALDRLYGVAHDIKGVAATGGKPLITDICASLCAMIETPSGKAAARTHTALLDAHVDAVRAAQRSKKSLDQDPTATAVLEALRQEVTALGVAPK